MLDKYYINVEKVINKYNIIYNRSLTFLIIKITRSLYRISIIKEIV